MLVSDMKAAALCRFSGCRGFLRSSSSSSRDINPSLCSAGFPALLCSGRLRDIHKIHHGFSAEHAIEVVADGVEGASLGLKCE